METAVRVLKTLVERQTPNSEDLKKLRQFAPEKAHAELDELACDVLQRALKQRAMDRAKGA